MATPYGVDTITTISRQFVMPDFMDEVYKSSPLIRRLYKTNRVAVQGGTQIEQGLLTARLQSGGAYSGYDILDIAPSDSIRTAAWDWRQYYKNVTVDGLTLIKVNSPDAVADYIRTYFQQAQMDMQADLAFDLWQNAPATGASAPNNPKGLDGLRLAIDDATVANVYGGIDRSVTANAFWKAQADHSTSAMTLDVLNKFHSKCMRGAQGPTAIYSRRDAYNIYWKLNTANQQYVTPLKSTIDDEVAVQAGFTNLYFNNMPWLCDDYVNDGPSTAVSSIYFIDETMAKLVVNSGRNFDMGDFQQGINQDAMTALIKFAGNFVLKSANTSGVMTAIAS